MEDFTPNRSINASLNEMLAGFPEPSPSRMRRKILNDIVREYPNHKETLTAKALLEKLEK